MKPLRLLLVAGARPNFMKVAPLIWALRRNAGVGIGGPGGVAPVALGDRGCIEFKLVHTGQHYDPQMSQVFFDELDIPKPDFSLEVGSGSHAVQTARVMERFEGVLLKAFFEPVATGVPGAPNAGGSPDWLIVVDERESLSAIMAGLKRVAVDLPVVLPIHPRTRKRRAEFGISLNGVKGLQVIEPIGYHDSLCLTEQARLVITDSGGLQEESTYFRTPCLTLRPNTERPVTITLGSNRLTDSARLSADIDAVLAREQRFGSVPPLWDGRTAERVLDAITGFGRDGVGN